MIFHRSLIAFSCFLLVACGQGPGAPQIRTNVDATQGRLISGCQNISHSDLTNTFIMGSYLTTWGSVWKEGVLEGMLPASETYCRSFEAPPQYTSAIVASIMNDILSRAGYGIETFDQKNGVFKTTYLDQQHATARWRDRYVIAVGDSENGESIVRVYRQVYLSRPGAAEKYNLATSVGHNEAYILNEVARRINI